VRKIGFLLVAVALTTTACEDPFASLDWDPAPVQLTLYSASRAEYVGRVSAFDLGGVPPRAVAIETEAGAGTWDILLVDEDGGLALAPAAIFPGVESKAGVATILNRSFDDVTAAPGGDAPYSTTPVPLQMNAVYVLRSRSVGCTVSSGPVYAKVRPLEIDVAAGTFTFEYVDNPNCGDRDLVPSED
jgi:hypothetical protein